MANTTLNTAKAWHPDVTVFPADEVMAPALIMQAATYGGRIEGDEPSIRVAFIDDAAAEFVDEFAEFPIADPDLNEITIQTRKVGLLTSVSMEQYRQQGAAGRLAESVRRSVITRADRAFIEQPAPTPPATAPATGLAAWPGISTATATGIPGMIDAAATVEDVGGNVDLWIASPKSWALMCRWTAVTSGALVLGSGTEEAPRRLLGRPVLVSGAAPDNAVLGIDKSSVISAYGDVEIATSEHAAFSRQGVAIRASWRIGHGVIRPKRLVKVTVSEPGP